MEAETEQRTERSVEASAKTVDEAVKRALAQLGVSREQTRIQVLREGSRGILGIGAEDARVRVTVVPPPTPPRPEPVVPAAPPPPEPALPPVESSAPPLRPAAHDTGDLRPAPSGGADADDVARVAQPLLEGLLAAMGLKARVETRIEVDPDSPDVPVIVLNIVGDDLGMLIGRRGETLAALQYLARLMVNKRMERRVSIVLDIEGYRQRRERTLRDLAKRMADRVARDGRTVVLEPMPANERRIIHLTLREHPIVTTYSIGDGEKRKVTIRLRR